MRRLLIDDQRNIESERVARTYEDGLAALQEGEWDILYLDHDLGCFDARGKEYTGYDVLCWLEQNLAFLPKSIVLVTSNPSGRLRMEQVIRKLYG